MRSSNAGCLNALISGFSRIVLLMFWIARPVQWNAAFGDAWLLACLGFLFLPFTTLMYLFLQLATPGPIQGLDWLWLGLAVVCDVVSTGSAAYTNRDRIPAGMPGSAQNP
ncbi:MAG: hypothetical protein IT331_25620 [Anaerolineae bacterium]|nr:hypothetical protein [Anaerolineae bacterium]